MNKKLILGAILVMLPLLFGLALLSDPVVAKVGEYKIRRSDVTYRYGVDKVFYPGDSSRPLSLEKLIKGYQCVELLKAHSTNADDEALSKEAQRIDAETLDPDTISRVKAVFGRHRTAYLHDFILPDYARKVLRDEVFPSAPDVQAESLSAPRQFLREVSETPAEFEAIAVKYNAGVRRFRASRQWGLSYEVRKGYYMGREPSRGGKPLRGVAMVLPEVERPGVEAEVKQWITGIVQQLEPGQIWKEIIDYSGKWVVVKYVGPVPEAKATYQLVTASFPQATFDDWVEKEMKQVPVVRYPAR